MCSSSSRRDRSSQERSGSTEVEARINAYLFQEFGIEGDEARVSDSWPFRLQEIGDIGAEKIGMRVFLFRRGKEAYFAEAGRTISFWEAAGWTIDDLRLHMLAEEWLARQNMVELSAETASDHKIPSITQRRRAVEDMARSHLDNANRVQVLEDLYFRDTNRHIGLIEDCATGRSFVVGNGLAAHPVRHDAAPWRRLYIGIGEMLLSGELQGSKW